MTNKVYLARYKGSVPNTLRFLSVWKLLYDELNGRGTAAQPGCSLPFPVIIACEGPYLTLDTKLN